MAADDIRYRLVLDGVVTEVAVRGVVRRRRTVHLPTNPNQAAWPAIRLAKHLSGGLEMTAADMMLTRLVEITGLLDTVLWCKPYHDSGWARVASLRKVLPAPLSELVAYADAAVGRGVLAGRGI